MSSHHIEFWPAIVQNLRCPFAVCCGHRFAYVVRPIRRFHQECFFLVVNGQVGFEFVGCTLRLVYSAWKERAKDRVTRRDRQKQRHGETETDNTSAQQSATKTQSETVMAHSWFSALTSTEDIQKPLDANATIFHVSFLLQVQDKFIRLYTTQAQFHVIESPEHARTHARRASTQHARTHARTHERTRAPIHARTCSIN